jgi:glycosyltransferase involved in cell wall biosynthesis
MSKISAIILVKNAENLIADCLDSVSFCDEIIVIDDTSTDRTADIAERLGAKVYSQTTRSFAEKREFGLKKAKNKWVLYVDVDERVSPELKENILSIVNKTKDEYSAYRIQRKNFYFGKHEWPTIEKLERLFKKSDLKEWHGEVHETAIVDGTIGELEGFLLHYTHQDITSMVAKTIEWSKIEADLRMRTNHPKMSWWRFFRVMVTAFYDSYIKQKGYKAKTAGLVESMYQSFSMFITYARLWEMQEERNNTHEKDNTKN